MVLFAILTTFIFFSCSNNTDNQNAGSQNNTLRFAVEQEKVSIEWVIETEDEESSSEDTLWQSNTNVVIEGSDYTPLFLGNFIEDDAVYPSLEGFGSLNTELIPNELYIVLNEFLSALKNREVSLSFFEEEKSYLKTIIDYDFQDYPKLIEYIVGEVFIFDNPSNAYEVPVRLFFDNGFADCFIYFVYNENMYTIEQFDIGDIKYE